MFATLCMCVCIGNEQIILHFDTRLKIIHFLNCAKIYVVFDKDENNNNSSCNEGIMVVLN